MSSDNSDTRCEDLNPKVCEPDSRFPRGHYERCIRPAGHVGRHDDVYGRWWGNVLVAMSRKEAS